MKMSKRIAGLLIAAAMLAACVVPVFAYTAVTPSGDAKESATGTAVTYTHTLTLTEENNAFLPYKATYAFTVGAAVVEQPTGIADTKKDLMVSGAPTIANVVYNSGTFTDKNTSNQYYKTQDLTIDWTGVSIKEPGVYSWSVSESVTMDPTSAPESATANLTAGKLVAYATDENGVLTFKYWYFMKNATEKGSIDDEFPATTNNLELTKTVTGSQGSRDQYFKFTVKVTLPAGAASTNYVLSGFDTADTVNASPYNTGAVQPTSPITLVGGTATDIVVWLKHGQTFKVEGLPKGTTYEIVEAKEDYDVDAITNTGVEHTEDKAAAKATGKIGDSKAEVGYTNKKDPAAPTGVLLAVGPAVAVIAAGAVGMGVVLAGKRRKEEEEE